MKIRDEHGNIIEIPRGVDIVADDGRTLYTITQKAGGVIEVSTSGACKQDEKVLDDSINIHPKAGNFVAISRDVWRS